jgi:hypothetical protein
MSKNKFNTSMFDKIKDALKKTDTGSGSFSNIMKFPAGHTFSIRLIPNVENIDETFFHHYVHSWNSRSTGKYTSALGLQTFGDNDPIANLRWKMYKEWVDANPNPGVDAQGKKITFKSPIDQKENWFVNALWIDNPATPELNGTVQILKMGYQLKGIVDDAMTGDRSEEFGARIFDLSKDGADLKVKAKKQGEYTTFSESFFTNVSKLSLDDDEIEKIYEQVHNLREIYPVKTEDELNRLLEEHFFCSSEEKKTEIAKQIASKPTSKPVVEEDDYIPMDFAKSEVQDDVDELLAGLDLED